MIFITSDRFKVTRYDVIYYMVLAVVVFAMIAVRLNIMKIIVPSGSMLPTLQLEDIIYCWKVNDPSKLSRGDLVVFYNEEYDMMMIKRLIGKPGEVVDIRDGLVHVDGIPLDEEYVVYFDSKTNGTFTVPEDRYFFLGDNRNNSNDSRYWKETFIPKEDIKAIAGFRVSPSSRIGFV